MSHSAPIPILLFFSFLLLGAPDAHAQSQETAKAQMRFGADMAKRGLWNEALFRFKRAQQLEPDRAEVYNNLGVAYEALGLFDKALENYRAGLRLSPGDKGLKGNYARFVEFYQRYKPDEEPPQGEKPVEAAPKAPEETVSNSLSYEQEASGSGALTSRERPR